MNSATSNSKKSIITVEDHLALPHQPGKPLLNVLRESKIYVEAHCREGFCGACRTKMVSGEVHYENMPLACLNEGEILPCCCEPVGDIVIKVIR
tara:strand:+ start:103681 stop:103962 length:282 start_codon:yes stop_codon:yes gene_type:complete